MIATEFIYLVNQKQVLKKYFNKNFKKIFQYLEMISWRLTAVRSRAKKLMKSKNIASCNLVDVYQEHSFKAGNWRILGLLDSEIGCFSHIIFCFAEVFWSYKIWENCLLFLAKAKAKTKNLLREEQVAIIGPRTQKVSEVTQQTSKELLIQL